jgi:hypothetical protein
MALDGLYYGRFIDVTDLASVLVKSGMRTVQTVARGKRTCGLGCVVSSDCSAARLAVQDAPCHGKSTISTQFASLPTG